MLQLGFEVEWFDPVANEVETLFLKYYLGDGTIELLHSRKNSTFLKRISYPSVTLKDLYINNSITIYSRLMIIKAYANSATEKYIGDREVHVLCTVARASSNSLADLSKIAFSSGMRLNRASTTSYKAHTDDLISSNGLVIHPGDIILEYVSVMEADVSAFLYATRALEGVNAATAGTDSTADVFRRVTLVEIEDPCTLCVVKPHVLVAKKQSLVLSAIVEDGRFVVDAVLTVHMTVDMAEEFFRVYRKIYPDFARVMEHMASSKCMALLIRPSASNNSPETVVQDFRDLCGPLNSELAAILRPKSLRAIAGNSQNPKNSIIENGVHCTDLPDDCIMECTFFFDVVARTQL